MVFRSALVFAAFCLSIAVILGGNAGVIDPAGRDLLSGVAFTLFALHTYRLGSSNVQYRFYSEVLIAGLNYGTAVLHFFNLKVPALWDGLVMAASVVIILSFLGGGGGGGDKQKWLGWQGKLPWRTQPGRTQPKAVTES